MKSFKKFGLLLVTALFAVLLCAAPVSAKTSTRYRSAYKNFLAKGSFSYTTSVRRSNSYGKWYTRKTKSYYKINKFALVNIDGKGQPELVLLSKAYPGKDYSKKNGNKYYVFVARMSGKKVKLAYLGTSTTKKGEDSDKAYTTKIYGMGYSEYSSSDKTYSYYTETFDLTGLKLRYDSVNKALIVPSVYSYSYDDTDEDEEYDEEEDDWVVKASYDYTHTYSYTNYNFYKMSGSQVVYQGYYELYRYSYTYKTAPSRNSSGSSTYSGLPDGVTGTTPSYIANYKEASTKAVTLYTNNSKNRKKVGNGKIKPVK